MAGGGPSSQTQRHAASQVLVGRRVCGDFEVGIKGVIFTGRLQSASTNRSIRQISTTKISRGDFIIQVGSNPRSNPITTGPLKWDENMPDCADEIRNSWKCLRPTLSPVAPNPRNFVHVCLSALEMKSANKPSKWAWLKTEIIGHRNNCPAFLDCYQNC